MHKPVVAIYLRYYLSPSETFVYRQLQGVTSAFRPIVLTANPSNLDRFPFDDIFIREKTFVEKVLTRLQLTITNHYTVLAPGQTRFWRNVLVENNVALIHAHFGHFALDLLPLARRLKIPMLVTFHGFDASILLGDRSYVRSVRELVEYAHVITVSNNMVERLGEVAIRPPKLNVHYIGVPVEDFVFVQRAPLKDKVDIKFLQISNFVEVKGHRYTVEAFARYLDKHPQSSLTFTGDGPLRTDIEALCSRVGIRDSVRFTGVVRKDRVKELMAEADVFLQHSVTLANGCKEGLPTVLMEAMSTGLTVITTNHSGIPELVEHGSEGFLVEERDVDGYVAALEGLSDADSDMPKRARAKIERHFNMTDQNEKLKQIYETAMNDHSI